MTEVSKSHATEGSIRLPHVEPRNEATLALLGHDLRAALSDVVRALLMRLPTVVGAPGRLPVASARDDLAMDIGRLHRLLEMAGPETGRDLLDRLIADLCAVQRGLAKVTPMPDWQTIRSQSHILISLAGAVGGLQLQVEAEALNLIGHRMDTGALDGLLPGVEVHLDAMIVIIRQIRHSRDVGLTP